jgi:hypothetical protein
LSHSNRQLILHLIACSACVSKGHLIFDIAKPNPYFLSKSTGNRTYQDKGTWTQGEECATDGAEGGTRAQETNLAEKSQRRKWLLCGHQKTTDL